MIIKRWKITVVDAGNGKTYTKEVKIEGGTYAMLAALKDVADDIAPNSIHSISVECLGSEGW